MPKRRKDTLSGKTVKVRTECGAFYLTMNEQDGDLFEVRMELGKSGHCQKGLLHLLSVLISDRLQKTEEFKEIKTFLKRQLEGVSCGNPFFANQKNYLSCIDWAAQQILEEVTRLEKAKPKEEEKK